jgi:hypothetical protein
MKKLFLLALFVEVTTGSTVFAAPGQASPIAKNISQSESAYMIVPDSLSPDRRHAVAMLKESPDDPSSAHNFLVAVKPFKVLTMLDGDGLYPDSRRLDLEARWTADSSRVLVTTIHDKWDMIVGSPLVVLADGKVARQVNFLDAINNHLLADFKKSGAEPYNDVLPFILTDSKLQFVDQGQGVEVKTEAGNDPNIARNIAWTADFEGVYRVADGTWENQKLKSESEAH